MTFQRKIFFNKGQENEIINLYEKELLNPTQIGKRFSCSSGPIKVVLSNNSINMNMSHRKILLISKGKIKTPYYDKHGKNNPFYNKYHTGETKEKNRLAHIGKHPSEEARKNMSEAQKKRMSNPEERKKVSKQFKGIPKSEEHKIQLSKNNGRFWKGKHLSDKHKNKLKERNIGKHHSEETKRKMRLSAINYIKKTLGDFKHEMFPNVGHNEKKLLDELEQKMNIKILRQFEVDGYFVDGYIPKLRLVIEIDEKPKDKEKDIKRQNTIEKELNCKFIRINDF